MEVTIYSTGHNGPGDCLPQHHTVTSLQAAKQLATREAAGDRCHITICDERGNLLARRDARDTYNGCCNGGWLPWEAA
jgi:hypothetical protein